MRYLFVVALAALTLIAMAGCSDDTGDPKTGSETHWLSCNTTSDCPTGHTCVERECRPVIEASGYDQSCQSDSDCTVITEGDFCTCVGCPNAAINVADEPTYQADMQAAVEACADSRTTCGSLEEYRTRRQAASCSTNVALCIQGTCEIFEANSVDEDVDRSCQSDSDCVAAPIGFCQACDCQTAVSQEGYALAQRIRTKLGNKGGCSATSGQTCACTDLGPPECIDGTCQSAGGGQGCNPVAWDSAICE